MSHYSIKSRTIIL